jgi:hypothetical protein
LNHGECSHDGTGFPLPHPFCLHPKIARLILSRRIDPV